MHHNTLNPNVTDDTQRHSILNGIEEGMEVYSSDNEHIGEVEEIYFGAVSEADAEMGTGAATADNPALRERSFLDNIANVFDDNDMPEEMRARLQHEGFIRIDSGLFSDDHFATPSQIASVSGDKVILKATKDQLLET